MICLVAHLVNIEVNLIFKTVEHYKETFFANLAGLADKPESASVLLEDTVFVILGGEIEAFRNRTALHYNLITITCLYSIRVRLFNPAGSAVVFVVIENYRSFVTGSVRVGKHIFVYMTVFPEIVEKKVIYAAEKVTLFHQREDVVPVSVYKILARLFVLVSFGVFHSVFLGKAFNLAVTEHRKARHSNHQSTDTKIFVAITKLGNGSFLIRIVHKVYIALKNLRIKGDCIFYRLTVFLIFFFFEHVHKGRVVNAVHTESTHKVAFHHPEGFSKKKSVRAFCRNPVYNLAPELIRNCVIELLGGKAGLRPCRNISSMSRLRIPESADRFFSQNHCRIKTDDREVLGNMQNLLHNSLAGRRIQKVNLSSVVPRKSCSVISVVDVAGVSSLVINTLENYRAVVLAVVVVFQKERNAAILRKVFSIVSVLWKRIITALNKIIRVIDNPVAVHTRVVRNHIRSKSDSPLPAALTKICQGIPATDIRSNVIIKKRVGRSSSLRVTANLLDAAACLTSLPKTNQPEAGKALVPQLIKLGIRNLIQACNRVAVLLCKLIQPDKNSLRNQDNLWHPLAVGGEALIFVHQVFKAVGLHVRKVAAAKAMPGSLFLF